MRREPILAKMPGDSVLRCSGFFTDAGSGKMAHHDCGKSAIVLFEVADPNLYEHEGTPFTLPNALVGACEEHEANRRDSYDGRGWRIIRAWRPGKP